MVALKVEDMKQFTQSLFIGDMFDSFLVREAEIVTFNTFRIDGKVEKEYYTEDELEARQIGELSRWEAVKPICFTLIKGKKLPGSFRIVFVQARPQTEEFLNRRQLSVRSEQISGLYVNVRYEGGAMYCITGTSVNFFTMDKALENEWDEAVKEFLRENKIPYVSD